jgi:hypothetical protein
MRINSATMQMESIPFIMYSDILKYLRVGLSCTKPRVWEMGDRRLLLINEVSKETWIKIMKSFPYAERFYEILTQVMRRKTEC